MGGGVQSQRNLRIVVVEDNPYDAELMESYLKTAVACDMVVVKTRAAFLDELENRPPDVIISDSNVPSFDGMTALKLAQELCPCVPFIFCSGAEPHKDRMKGLDQGARAWVSKDEFSRLAEMVRELGSINS